MQATSRMQSTTLSQSQSQSHSLPIKQVTLYKNDLAFLKRSGKVSTAQLEIAESIKDLVSSTLNVTAEVPVSVLFGSKKESACEPDYGFQYGTRSNMGAFLDSLIGARVRLDIAGGDGSSVVSCLNRARNVRGINGTVTRFLHTRSILFFQF